MKVKRYFASSMRSALDMVKQEQGPDVLILSNRKVDGGVELITADELTEQEASRLTERSVTPPRPQPETTPAALPTTGKLPGTLSGALFPDNEDTRDFLWTDAGTVQQMRDELRSLKGLLETQMSGLAWSDFGTRHPLRARLLRVLAQLGIAPSLARELVAGVPDELDYHDGWHRALATLALRMNVIEDPIAGLGGRVALLGPTGVGKTTLASKMAARYALEHGPEAVVIVSMDDRRLGAHQQTKAFGRLLGCPVYTLRDCDELAGLVEDFEARQLIIIDTPGASSDDPRYRELVLGLNALNAGIQMYNVISATTDYHAASKMLRFSDDVIIDACILTKLDEAATLGPALSAIIESALPLAYTSAGQRVPDDLDTVHARSLVERTVELARSVPREGDAVTFERAFQA